MFVGWEGVNENQVFYCQEIKTSLQVALRDHRPMLPQLRINAGKAAKFYIFW